MLRCRETVDQCCERAYASALVIGLQRRDQIERDRVRPLREALTGGGFEVGRLGAATFGERVAARAGQLPQAGGLVPRIGQTDSRHGPKSDVAPTAMHHRSQRPAPGTARIDLQVQAAAVSVPPCPLDLIAMAVRTLLR